MRLDDLPQEYLWPAGLLSYLAWGIALYLIAKKTRTENPWMAWVPVLNLFLLVSIARLGCLWVLALFVPCVGFFAAIYVWWKICELRGKPGILSVLMLIPGVNLLVALYLGLAD